MEFTFRLLGCPSCGAHRFVPEPTAFLVPVCVEVVGTPDGDKWMVAIADEESREAAPIDTLRCAKCNLEMSLGSGVAEAIGSVVRRGRSHVTLAPAGADPSR